MYDLLEHQHFLEITDGVKLKKKDWDAEWSPFADKIYKQGQFNERIACPPGRKFLIADPCTSMPGPLRPKICWPFIYYQFSIEIARKSKPTNFFIKILRRNNKLNKEYNIKRERKMDKKPIQYSDIYKKLRPYKYVGLIWEMFHCLARTSYTKIKYFRKARLLEEAKTKQPLLNSDGKPSEEINQETCNNISN